MDHESEDEGLVGAADLPIRAEGGDALSAESATTNRKVRRRGRRTRMRSRTIAPKRLTKEEIRMGALLSDVPDVDRPRLRADCKDVARPCPFVSCKHHLYLDVNPETGSIKLNFPDLEVWEMTETCALDVADRGGATLEEVGAILNLTRERIRQVEVRGLLRLKTFAPGSEDEFVSPAAVAASRAFQAPRACVKPQVMAAEDLEAGLELDLPPELEDLPLDMPLDAVVEEIAADMGELAEDFGGSVAFAEAGLLMVALHAGK